MDEHPLDEAQGYAALMELQLDTYPIVEAIQKMVAEVTGESAAPAINGKADLSPRLFLQKKVTTGELPVCRVCRSRAGFFSNLLNTCEAASVPDDWPFDFQ